MASVAVTVRPAVSMAARQRALFAVLCFVWGTTWLAMKVGIAVVPPGVFAGTRWTDGGTDVCCSGGSRAASGCKFPCD